LRERIAYANAAQKIEVQTKDRSKSFSGGRKSNVEKTKRSSSLSKLANKHGSPLLFDMDDNDTQEA
jgi:hypothetical protein